MTLSTRSNLRALLFAATAVGALATYGVGRAAAADAATATASPGAGATTSTKPATDLVATTDTAATDDASGAAIQEVVVTAQRREESIQNVPATIQAFTGQVLSQQNIQTLDDLIKYTPNVTFGNNGPGQGVIFMRGLSAGLQGNQSSATIATFPNVALYLDDQSMQFPGRNVDIYAVDLSRVEVLEGPQGTLFGGGAEAGAIRYITNQPNLSRFTGSAEAAYGATVGGGATTATTPATPAEQRELSRAPSAGAAPLQVGDQVIRPGVVHADIASAFSSLPTPLLAILLFLVACAVALAGGVLRNRVRGHND